MKCDFCQSKNLDLVYQAPDSAFGMEVFVCDYWVWFKVLKKGIKKQKRKAGNKIH